MQILSDLSEVLVLGPRDFAKEVDKQSPGLEYEFENYFNSNECVGKLKQLFRGRVSEDEFWDDLAATMVFRFPEICEKNGNVIDSDWLRDLFYQTAQTSIPETIEVYERILYHPIHVGKGGRVEKGVPDICIVADHVHEMIPVLHSWHPGIFAMAGAEVWSSRFGQVKTDPCFFSFLLNGFHGDPDEYLFISKDEEAIDLAKKSGIPCIEFIDAEQMEEEMSQLGFMFSPKEEL